MGKQTKTLTAVVYQCRGLKKVEGWRKNENDPYVQLTIEENTQKTSVVKDGGSEAEWPGGSAHVFQPSEAAHILEIAAFDDDVGGDDLIGTCSFNLIDLPDADGARIEKWVQLEDGDKMKVGEVLLELYWTIREAEGQEDGEGETSGMPVEAVPPTATPVNTLYPLENEPAGKTRGGMTLAQATAYCARIPDCCGMWFVKETGQCEPFKKWNPNGIFIPMVGAGLYQLRELPEDLTCSAPIVASRLDNSESVCFYSSFPLSETITHVYAEVTFSHPTKTDMANDGFFGLTNHNDTQPLNDMSKYGAWGFKDDKDSEALRQDGKASGDIPKKNQDGRGFSGGDQLGLLVDQKRRHVQFYRNGEVVEGAEVRGWEQGEKMWLAACVPSSEWTATWTFRAGYAACNAQVTEDQLELLRKESSEWHVPQEDVIQVHEDSSDEEDDEHLTCSLPTNNKNEALPVDPPKLGKCSLMINIIDACDLVAKDSSGTSDPLVKIRCEAGKKNGELSSITSEVKKTLSPFWDESFSFDFEIEDEWQLDTQKVFLEVWDSDAMSDDLIGNFELDLGFLWRQENHELHRRWFGLSDPSGEYLGVQGYLRASAVLLLDGEEPKTVHDKSSYSDEVKDVLLGSSVETIDSVVKINCFSGQELPDMDRTGGGGAGNRCDPFVSVTVDGIMGSTKYRSGTTNPTWNETVTIPVKQPAHGPKASCRVRIAVVDHDESVASAITSKLGITTQGDGFMSKVVSKAESLTGLDIDDDGKLGADGEVKEGALEKKNDLIGFANIDFEELEQGFWQHPCWVNLYGAPSTANNLENLVGEAKQHTKRMNNGAAEASEYRGRVLISASVRKNEADPKLLCNGQLPITRKKMRKIQTERPLELPFKLHVCIVEGASLPYNNKKLRVEVAHGVNPRKYTARRHNRIEGRKKEKTGRARWYSELEIFSDFPDDVSQIPDIFINLVDEDGDRLSYVRIPVFDQETTYMNRQDIWDLDDMRNFDGLHKVAWYKLKRDVFGPLTADQFPGLLSVCVGFGRVDHQRIGNRLDPLPAIDYQKLGFEMLGREKPSEHDPRCKPYREGLSFKAAVAWCRSLPDCTGMWFGFDGVCIPYKHWKASTLVHEPEDGPGALYRICPCDPEQGHTAEAVEELAYELITKSEPERKVEHAGGPRTDLSFRNAVAWCQRLDDCTGMWFDGGTCTPIVSWDKIEVTDQQSDAGVDEDADGFYEIHKTGALPPPTTSDIQHIKEHLIPQATELVDKLKDTARDGLAVTVLGASGLQLPDDVAVAVTARGFFVRITAAAREYPRGDMTTYSTKTVEIEGNRPQWNEPLDFAEVELVRSYPLVLGRFHFRTYLTCYKDGILFVEVFEKDLGDAMPLGETVLPIADYHDTNGKINVVLQPGGATTRFAKELVEKEKLRSQASASDGPIVSAKEEEYNLGQVTLNLLWDKASAEDKSRYQGALTELIDHKDQLSDAHRAAQQKKKKKQKKMESENEEMERGDDDILRPEEKPHAVLVHVYSAQNVPSGDENGSCDPLIRASLAGSAARTSAKAETHFPHWYETLVLRCNLPVRLNEDGEYERAQDYFDADLAPPLVLELFDHDKFSGNDFIGSTVVSLKSFSADRPEEPSWYPIVVESGQVCGRVMVSVQILGPHISFKTKIPQQLQTIKPTMRQCTIEFFLLGCRGLQSASHIKPRSPYVTCKLNGDSVRGLVATGSQSLPTANGPNYLEIIRINCSLPDNPAFSPSMAVTVLDRQFGLRHTVLGKTCIQLGKYLPWIKKNRQRILIRHALAIPSRSQSNAASLLNKPDGEPEPELDDGSDKQSILRTTTAEPGDYDEEIAGLLSELPAQQRDVETGDVKTNVKPPGPSGKDDDSDEEIWRKPRLLDTGEVLDDELEDELERRTPAGATRHPFDEWDLMRKLQVDRTGTINTRVTGGHLYGSVKGLVRVIDHSGREKENSVAREPASTNMDEHSLKSLKRVEVHSETDCLPFPMPVHDLQRPEKVVVRLYVVQAFNLAAVDIGNTADPYVTARLGNEIQGDNKNHVKRNLSPYFGQCFEFYSTMPGPSSLVIEVKDYDVVGRDDHIGHTIISLEDRWFSKQWQDLPRKPLERRTLRLQGSKTQRGKLECWVDIFNKSDEKKNPIVDIARPPPALFEMRLVIWRARKVTALDMLTQMNDMFVRAQLTTVGQNSGKPDRQLRETDVHWRAKGNKGSFNWRMKFDVELPLSDNTPSNGLSLKCMDKDPMTFSEDMIGYHDIDIKTHLFKPALTAWRKYRTFCVLCCSTSDGIVISLSLALSAPAISYCCEHAATELQETELQELDTAGLRAKLEQIRNEQQQRQTNSAGARAVPTQEIPANATREELVQMVRDQSNGEASVAVRYPNEQAKEEGNLVALAKKMRKNGGEPVPRKWVQLKYPGMEDGVSRGELEISIELLPKSLADKRLAGEGRDPPNAHPELPEPEGRESFSVTSPFAALKSLVGSRVYGQLCGMIYFVLLMACCWFMVPLVGSQVVADVFTGD